MDFISLFRAAGLLGFRSRLWAGGAALLPHGRVSARGGVAAGAAAPAAGHPGRRDLFSFFFFGRGVGHSDGALGGRGAFATMNPKKPIP